MKKKLHALSLAGCTALKACLETRQGTGSKVLCLSVWSSDIHIVVCAEAGQFGEAYLCTFCWKSLLKAFCTSAKGLLYTSAKGLLYIC